MSHSVLTRWWNLKAEFFVNVWAFYWIFFLFETQIHLTFSYTEFYILIQSWLTGGPRASVFQMEGRDQCSGGDSDQEGGGKGRQLASSELDYKIQS